MTIAIFSLVIGAFYATLTPKYRSIYQGASWQESLHGAEAGADYGLLLLNQLAASTGNPDTYDWTTNHWSYSNASYTSNGERILDSGYLPALGGSNRVAVTRLAVDVYTRDSAPPYTPWYRIRSTARADLPGKYVSVDKRDAELRRMKLTAKNGSLDDPHVTRTVELIARPKFRFSRAITTAENMSLGNSANWRVDSFDSSDSAYSDPGTIAGGIYPLSAAQRLANGSVATLLTLPSGVTYGALIDGNGAVVMGDVLTAGGDDPGTAAHENVSGSGGMDQTRIHDDFDDEIPPVTEPVWSIVSGNPAGNTNFVTGNTPATTTRYIISGNLGAFAVVAPSAGNTGYIEILINGDLDIGSGNSAEIVIPPNVYATIYVDGNIDFGNGEVNSNSASSMVATHLTVYGVHATGTYSAAGNGTQILTFYGPNYNATLSGTTTTIGSIVSKTFNINGGGNGGFHYDEALGRTGNVAGWTMVSYFDDARTDL